MDGRDLRAGSVTGLQHVACSPIQLARLVMDHSPHVMLAGNGAEEFALEQGLEPVAEQLFRDRASPLDARAHACARAGAPATRRCWAPSGGLRLDAAGNLAAATSTGGMTGKSGDASGTRPSSRRHVRSERLLRVSATGHGEFFIRAAVAHEIASLMRYRGLDLPRAADEVVMKQLVRMGGSGGVVAVARDGSIAMRSTRRACSAAQWIRRGRVTTGILRE